MNTASPHSKWLRAPGPVAAILIPTLVALAFRLIYLLTFRHAPGFSLPIMDEAVHDGWARGSMQFLYDGVPYFRAPLYMWFLEACYRINDGYTFVRVVQVLLSTLTVTIIADLGRRMAGPVAGMISGLLLAFCWPVIYFSGELVIVTFFAAIVVAGLWCLVVAGGRRSLRLALAGAALLGIASMARPTVLIYAPALLWLTLRTWKDWLPSRVTAALLLVGLLLLPGLALTVRNQVVGDDLVFIASQGGVNFYIGNNAQSDGRTAVVPGTSGTWGGGYEQAIALAEAEAGHTLRPSGVSRHYYGKGLHFLATEPGAAFGLYAKKLRLLLGAAERSNNKNPHFWRAQNPFLALPVFSSWALIFGLGLVGLILVRRRPEAAPLHLFLALYALGLLLFFLNERFRTPEAIVLATFSGIPPVAAWNAWSGDRRRAVFVLLAVFGLITLSSLDRIGFKGDRVEADAFSQYTLGNYYLAAGDAHRAAASYQAALDAARTWHLAGFAEVERMTRDRLVQALLWSQNLEAAKLQAEYFQTNWPDDWRTPLLEGRIAAYERRYGYARRDFENALGLNPQSVEAWVGLARAQTEQNVFEQARDSLRQATAIGGERADIYGVMALLELSSGGTAGRCWRLVNRAFELDPGDANAHHVAGELYLREQNISAMLYHFRQALLRDPNNVEISRYLLRSKSSPEELLASEDLVPPPPRKQP